MLMNQTIDKLNYMKLFGVVKGLEEQRANPNTQELSFEERISLLIDSEWIDRENRMLVRLLKGARLKTQAALEDIDFSSQRGLDRSIIAELSSSDWIERHRNIIICGATGTGKTYLACAFGNGACRHGLRTLYLRVPKLFEEIKMAKVDGSYMRFMTKISRLRLLILDDFGISAFSDTEAKDFMEVIEECIGKTSVIIAGQLPLENWHEAIGNPTIADAVLDRIVHNSYKFNLKGESMRKKLAPKHRANSDTL